MRSEPEAAIDEDHDWFLAGELLLEGPDVIGSAELVVIRKLDDFGVDPALLEKFRHLLRSDPLRLELPETFLRTGNDVVRIESERAEYEREDIVPAHEPVRMLDGALGPRRSPVGWR